MNLDSDIHNLDMVLGKLLENLGFFVQKIRATIYVHHCSYFEKTYAKDFGNTQCASTLKINTFRLLLPTLLYIPL
jgi:hypothetical protein